MDSINSPHQSIIVRYGFILVKQEYVVWIEYGDRGLF